MNQREQLELAARAYWGEEFEDVSIRWSEADDGILYIHSDNQDHNGLDREFVWAPHRDQADSDRMACDLEIDIDFVYERVWASHTATKTHAETWHNNTTEGRRAAVREARLLVAAEIGRAMS